MWDWRTSVPFVELLLNWLWLKSHLHPHIFLINHALQTFKLTTGSGQCKNKLKHFLWSTWECPVTSFRGENISIFLVPMHILKIKECHVISFSYWMSTQNSTLKIKKFYCNRSCHACSVTKTKVESRQIRKYVNKLCFLSDASFSDLVSLKSDASIYVISQKTNTFFSICWITLCRDKLEKFGGQIDMWWL